MKYGFPLRMCELTGTGAVPFLHTGAAGVPPAGPGPPEALPRSHAAIVTWVPALSRKSVYVMYSRPRAGSMAMKSLSRKLQMRPNLCGAIWVFWHWVLLAMVTGGPQLSVAPLPEPTTLQASIATLDRPRPVGASNRPEM